MEKTRQGIAQLSANLQNLNIFVHFLDAAGKYLSSNKVGVAPDNKLSAALEKLALPVAADCRVPGTKWDIHPCRSNGKLIFYAVIPRESAGFVSSYIDALALLIFDQNTEDKITSIRHLRAMLASQLANFSELTSEPEGIINTLGYSSEVWRVALL